jgi:hypothetical protein
VSRQHQQPVLVDRPHVGEPTSLEQFEIRFDGFRARPVPHFNRARIDLRVHRNGENFRLVEISVDYVLPFPANQVRSMCESVLTDLHSQIEDGTLAAGGADGASFCLRVESGAWPVGPIAVPDEVLRVL